MNLKNNEPCPHCGRYANRGVSVNSLIVKDNKILLIKRGVEPFKGYWALSGGYVDWDETMEQAVKREVKEELNLSVKKVTYLGIYSEPTRHPRQTINVTYVVEADGEPQAGDDAQAVEWVDLHSLPDELALDHRKIIDDYLTLFLNK